MSSSNTTTKKLNIPPGINKNTTSLDAEPAYTTCDKIRFFYDKPEKIGGWQREIVDGSFFGVARDIHSWVDLSSENLLGVGTHLKLHLFLNGTMSDITPITASASADNVWNTSAGSTEVILSVNPQGRSEGDFFVLTSTTASVGGIGLEPGTMFVITSVGVGHIVFDTTATAVSSEAGVGGPVKVDYLLESGLQSNGAAFGWGAGTWDTPGISASAGWGEIRSVGIDIDLRQWSLDNYGEDLLANPRGGKIYRWAASAGATQRATVLATAAPSIVNVMSISQEARHVLAFGTHNVSGLFDPLLVRWSDSESFDEWVASAGNQAGDFRLESGSFIIGIQETRGEILIFTDESVYSMTRIGGDFVFSFRDKGTHNGLQSQHSAVDINGVVYWMGYNTFHMYDGVIRTLPSSLQKFIFEPDSEGSINVNQREKVFAAPNKEFNEIWWFYPSKNSIENDRYIIFNYEEETWYHGTLDRTVWQDVDIFARPYAFDASGVLFIHEQGKDDDTAGLKATLGTSFFDLDDGGELMWVDRIIPDNSIIKEMRYNLEYKKYPQSDEVFTKGPFLITPDTVKFHPRLRGRVGSITYSTSIQGGDFRLGADRISLRPDGKR